MINELELCFLPRVLDRLMAVICQVVMESFRYISFLETDVLSLGTNEDCLMARSF